MALFGSLGTPGVANTNIGYTPFNKAGDSVSGAISRNLTITNRKIPMTDNGIFITAGIPTNNNVFQTVFGLRDINVSQTGTEYSFATAEVGGLISIYGEFGNAAFHSLIAFSGKHLFGFSHLSILSSYAYNSAIQISGRDIQVRQAGDNSNIPVYLRIFTYTAS